MSVKTKRMSKEQWNKLPKLNFHNVCKDFDIEVGILRKLSENKMKVAVEFSSSQNEIGYETKVAKIENGKWWIHYSGSPCNNYWRNT